MGDDQNKQPQSDTDEQFELRAEITEFHEATFWTQDAIVNLFSALDLQATRLYQRPSAKELKVETQVAYELVNSLMYKATEIVEAAQTFAEALHDELIS